MALNEIPRSCACIVTDRFALSLALAAQSRILALHRPGLSCTKDEIMHDEVYGMLVPHTGTRAHEEPGEQDWHLPRHIESYWGNNVKSWRDRFWKRLEALRGTKQKEILQISVTRKLKPIILMLWELAKTT